MMVGKVKVAKEKVAKLGIEEPRCYTTCLLRSCIKSPANCGVLVVFCGIITRSKKGKGKFESGGLGGMTLEVFGSEVL